MASRTEYRCPLAKCGKRTHVTLEERNEVMQVVFKHLACGHMLTEPIIALPPLNEGMKLVCAKHLVEVDPDNYTDFNEHKDCEWEGRGSLVEIPKHRLPTFARLRPFQQTGGMFLEDANFSAGLLDEQGLGKTVQCLYAIDQHVLDLAPILYLVKASLRLNWANEMVNNKWITVDEPSDYPFILLDGKSELIPGFKHYIVPFSLLTTKLDVLQRMGFKTVVVDEFQAFSNLKAARTKALLELIKPIKHRIGISGTPILNRASEYFPMLHMVKPDHWSNYKLFENSWLDYEVTDNGGKRIRGIKSYRRDEFFKRTSTYLLRRNKRDVLADLPKFKREFTIVDIRDSGYKDAYNNHSKALDNYMHSEQYEHDKLSTRQGTIMGYLNKMRHLCGMAKVLSVLEIASEFLESTDRKLIIGVHHDDVMNELAQALKVYLPILMPSGLDAIDRQSKIDQFKQDKHRLCILKILAQGEGLNLQFCSDMIIMERMWNPGKEEQLEARIDRYGQKNPTRAQYPIAKNTVDEKFTALVEDKRQFIGQSLDKNFDIETDPQLMMHLAEWAAKNRL